MHPLLEKLMGKKGIKNFDDLNNSQMPDGSPSEKQTFENYNLILSKDELTTEDIRHFCQSQIDVVEAKWKDLNTSPEKKAELIAIHTIYKTLLSAIDSPRSARESLEKYLIDLTK